MNHLSMLFLVSCVALAAVEPARAQVPDDCYGSLVNVNSIASCIEWCGAQDSEGVFTGDVGDLNVWQGVSCACSSGKSCIGEYELPTCKSVSVVTCESDTCDKFCQVSGVGFPEGPGIPLQALCETNLGQAGDEVKISCACSSNVTGPVIACDDELGGGDASSASSGMVTSALAAVALVATVLF